MRGDRHGPGFKFEENTLTGLIGQVCHLHHHRMRAALHDLDLHRGQPRLLHLLWEREGWAHSELAGAMHVEPATVTKMLQRMERRGFVQRRPDPEDERISRVYLGEAGRRVRERLEQALRELERELLSGFTEEEGEQLHRFLVRMRDGMMPQSRSGQ
jgi:DNA-binding MarR family transcriptional regulator